VRLRATVEKKAAPAAFFMFVFFDVGSTKRLTSIKEK
jgi:hypothetical protein